MPAVRLGRESTCGMHPLKRSALVRQTSAPRWLCPGEHRKRCKLGEVAAATALVRKMATDFSDAAAEAARIAAKMGSVAVDVVSFMTELGEEVPVIQPVLKSLIKIRETAEAVESNREELEALHKRCTYITAFFITKRRRNTSSELDVTPVEDCIEEVKKFVERCRRRGRMSRILKASRDKGEIAGLNERIDRVAVDLGLAGLATLEGKTDGVRDMLVSCVVSMKSTLIPRVTILR